MRLTASSLLFLFPLFWGCSSSPSTYQRTIAGTQPSVDTSLVSWELSPKIESNGSLYQVNAQATLNSTSDRVYANAIDYASYPLKNVPTVKEAHIVSQSDSDMIVWFHTSLDTKTAEYFVKVHVERDASTLATAISWTLTPKQPEWTEPDNNAVKILSGYWELAPAVDHHERTHVKYHLEFQPNTWIPSVLIKNFLDSAFNQEATALFNLMAQ